MRTALGAGALLAFALSFDEIIVTTFTIGAGEETLPIWIFRNLFRPNQLPIVNVVAVLVVLLSIVPVYLAHRLTREEGASVAGRGGRGDRGRGDRRALTGDLDPEQGHHRDEHRSCETDDRVGEAVEPGVDALDPFVENFEALVDLFEALVDLFESLVHLFEALVDLVELHIHFREAAVDVLKTPVDLFEAPIHLLLGPLESLLDQPFDPIETGLHLGAEFDETALRALRQLLDPLVERLDPVV